MKNTSVAAVLLATATILIVLPASTSGATFTDTDTLNFALNLEAEFYAQVAYGKSIAAIDSALVGASSNLTATSSGAAASSGFSAATLAYATEVAENEINHVRFLRKALGSNAVACPSLDLSSATFPTAAKAAVSAYGATLATNTSSTAFDPYHIESHFWLAAFIFEDVGVTAYNGAVSVLADASLASTASGIEAVEAMHAALVRYELFVMAANATGLTLADGTAVPYATAVAGIAKLRDVLGGTSSSSVENNLTRTPTPYTSSVNTTGPALFAVNSAAVAFVRSPYQVLNIVYFSSKTSPGGFFPHGVTGNSALASSSATPAESRCASTS